jgi:hypothetical protein
MYGSCSHATLPTIGWGITVFRRVPDAFKECATHPKTSMLANMAAQIVHRQPGLSRRHQNGEFYGVGDAVDVVRINNLA